MDRSPVAALSVPPKRHDATPATRAARRQLSELASVILRGLGQLALVDTAPGGGLVLAAIAFISPWCAVGAAAGTILGTFVGYRYTGVTREEWRSGFAGFNCAVIGIMAGGFGAADIWRVDAILVAVTLCFIVEHLMRRVLRRWTLPVLTMPAVIAVVATSLMLAPAGTWLWANPAAPPLGTTGVALGILCVVLAMASKSVAATLQVAVLTCMLMLSYRALGADPLALTGLWAFTIAPASFTVHAVFMRGSLLGGMAGLVAAAIGAAVWVLWYSSGLGDFVPPLLAPFIIGVWCALALFRRLGQPAVLQPSFWQAFAALWKSGLLGRRVVALIADTPSSTPRSSLPNLGATTCGSFIDSPSMRRARWRACQDLRERIKCAAPNATHKAIALLQRRHMMGRVITFAVDGLLQRAGATNVVELRGRLDTVRCLGCRAEHEWPPVDIWQSRDLHCVDCGGLIIPAPPSAKDVFEATRRCVSRWLARDGVLIVLGTPEDSRVTRTILGEARARGVRIINITPSPSSTPLRTGEILVRDDICRAMRSLALLLIASCLVVRFPGVGTAPAEADSLSERP